MWRTIIRALAPLLLSLIILIMTKEAKSQFYVHSYALVIGIDHYASQDIWKPLSYAVKDAMGISQFLRNQGFIVTSLYNRRATKEEIVYQMQNYLAPRLKEVDRVLVFFAGHGYTEPLGGEDYGYIVPYDGKSYSASYISMEELRALSLKMGNAKHQLFIMDSCYGGSLGTRSGGLDEGRPDYLDQITKRKAKQILTAGGKNQQVIDGGPGGHSIFTGHLLKALEEGLGDRNGDGYITFSELTSYLVPAATTPLSTPSWSLLPGHELGEFVFRSPKGATLLRDKPLEIDNISKYNKIHDTRTFNPERDRLDEMWREITKIKALDFSHCLFVSPSDILNQIDQIRKNISMNSLDIRSRLDQLEVSLKQINREVKDFQEKFNNARIASEGYAHARTRATNAGADVFAPKRLNSADLIGKRAEASLKACEFNHAQTLWTQASEAYVNITEFTQHFELRNDGSNLLNINIPTQSSNILIKNDLQSRAANLVRDIFTENNLSYRHLGEEEIFKMLKFNTVRTSGKNLIYVFSIILDESSWRKLNIDQSAKGKRSE